MKNVTRRSIVKGVVAAGVAGASNLTAESQSNGKGQGNVPENILPLSCTSGVYTPPRGRALMKFSFDFPEPSAAFGGYQFAVRIYTTENTYAMDLDSIKATIDDDHLALTSSGLTCAGGQVKAPGSARCTVQRTADGTLTASAEARVPGRAIKSIAIIVRGVPRGTISRAGGAFTDPHDDEVLDSWPELNAGLNSPLLVVKHATGDLTALSLAAEPQTARPARFYLQPGPDSYRIELTYEREAWTTAEEMCTPEWCIRKGATYGEVARPHYAHVEQAFEVKSWEARTDVPSWMRDVSLVMALHGAHWTGYIFNDYARQLAILRWAAERIDPRKVLVFLPAWDGRYYWNYASYQTDPRMGGDAGFARLVKGAQKLGFHIVPMFGSNVANSQHPSFHGLEGGVTQLPGGVPWALDFVDWDNDRKGEANYPFMNLGTDVWRRHLQGRIAACIERFGVDGYFLDIVGCAQNNLQGDMYLGTRRMVEELGRSYPGKLAIGEMYFDALVGAIPVFHAGDPAEYPAAFYKYGRLFEHLSWPAPGRGSTGVHESGFSSRWKLPTANQRLIPTLTVVDDTFTRYRGEMEKVIEVAKVWKFPGVTT